MKRIFQKLLLVCICMLFAAGNNVTALAGESSISALAVSSSQIEIKWNPVDGASKYKVYRSASADTGFVKLSVVKETIYQDTDVKAGTSYYYRIVPVDKAAKTDMEDDQMTVKAKTAASTAVAKLKVQSPTKVKLYWNISKGAGGYEIYRSNKPEASYTLLAEVKGKNNTVYTDKTIVPGKAYYYKICPTVSNNGVAGRGSESAPIKVKTVAKPEITSISSVNSSAMKLEWKKVKGANGYEVYRSTKETSGYQKIAVLQKEVTAFTDKSIKSGKKYYYKVVTIGKLNGSKITSGYSEAASYRTLTRVEISSAQSNMDEAIEIKWKKVSRATKYKIYRAASASGTYKKIATVKATGKDVQTYTDTTVKPDKNYYYKVQAYSSNDGLIAAGKGDKSEYEKTTLKYAIMGKSTVTVNQMIKLFQSSGRSFPSLYKNKGASNIKKFCEIVLDESEREGVKAEVLFAQVCLETGYLSFGGQVKADQCNFGGLGATDDGAAGAAFKNVRTGIRAQVQHLKGYASKESLNQKCVDPRFHLLAGRRGTTPFVQQLGNGNWATDPDYAVKLLTLIKKMKSY